jgi:hypothetical protein
MERTPLVAVKMSVSTVMQGITTPGQKVATRENVKLEVPPAQPGSRGNLSFLNGTLDLTITDPTMISKLKLGESYEVWIIPSDPEG